MTTKELLEKIFSDDIENLQGQNLRITRVRVPGKEINFAHIISPSDISVYQNLGLHIGVHEGEDHSGETIGIMSFTPWESTVVAADVAMKSANVQIGFMDRFCGTLILCGEYSEVETAVKGVLEFFKNELHFATCNMHHR